MRMLPAVVATTSAVYFRFCWDSEGMSMQNCFTLADAGIIHTGGRSLSFWYKNSSNVSLIACFHNVLIVRIKLTWECRTVLQSELHFALYDSIRKEKILSTALSIFPIFLLTIDFEKEACDLNLQK